MTVVDGQGSRGDGTGDRRVELGSRVRVRDVGADEEDEYMIVRPVDADVPRGRISAESPVGRSLLGHALGEVVVVQTPGGARRLLVVDVSGGG